jgi:hypothetical protein
MTKRIIVSMLSALCRGFSKKRLALSTIAAHARFFFLYNGGHSEKEQGLQKEGD